MLQPRADSTARASCSTRAESPALRKCAVHMSLPGDSVQTCRSCTSVTPSTAPSAERSSSTSMCVGDDSDRIRKASRASEIARGNTHSATSTATTTSAYGQRVVTVTMPAISTPRLPTLSATTSM